MSARPEQFVVETTYLPAKTGPFLWQEFDSAQAEEDLRALSALGFRTLRVHLAWDAFMPSRTRVEPARLREAETLLAIAESQGLQLVPVLFAQSFGDSVFLPLYAIDAAAPRRGVRAVCDARVQIGGPRDLYADTTMVEIALLWLETMLSAFAGHPAIAAWDLGHDPATTVRPLRIEHLTSWVTLMSERIHAAGEVCRLTLGAGDILTARAVRPRRLAPLVDRLDFAVMPQRLRFGTGFPSTDEMIFLAQLAQSLSGAEACVAMNVCVASEKKASAPHTPRDPGVAAEAEAARYADALIGELRDAGCAAAAVWPSHSFSARVVAAPPFDRQASVGRAGIFGADQNIRPWGEAVAAHAARDLSVLGPSPWPQPLDDSDYFTNLPSATKELFTSWRSGNREPAGIVV